MTPFLVDAILVMIFSVIFAAILFVFARRMSGQESAGVHWRGIIPLAIVGGLIVTFAFNLLEKRVGEQPEETGEIILTTPGNPD